MARKFSLESVLSLTDRFTKPLADAGRKYSGFTKKLQTQFNGINRSVEKFNKNVRGKAMQAGKAGTVALAGGLAIATRQYIQFDDALVSAGAKFKDMNLATADGQKRLELLRKKARETGSATQFSAVQAAEGLEFLAMAGFNSEQAMGALIPMINLATASNTELARATDISSDLLGAFNLASDDAAIQTKNLIRLNDVLAKTSASANVTLEDMFETMKVAGPIASGLNIPLEEVATLTGVLGNAGLKGTVGGTALKNMLLSLSAPTSAASKALAQLGVNTKDSAGNLKSPTQLLKEMKEGLDRIPGTANKAAILNDIFGKIPIAAMTKLVNSLGEVDALSAILENAGGSAEQMAALMRESLGNQLKILGSAATELGFKFISAFDEDGRSGIKSLTDAISNFDVTPIVKTVKTLFSVIAFGYKIMKPFLPLIIGTIAALQAYEFIIKVVTIAQKAWSMAMAVYAAKAKILIALQKAWTAVTWAVNAAMAANPIVLVTVAVIALIGAVVRLVKIWDRLVESFQNNGFIGAFKTFFGFGKEVKPKLAKVSEEEYTKKLRLESSNQSGSALRQPIQSQPVRGTVQSQNNTTTYKSEVGINVNAPKGTTVEQRGNPAPNTTLNLGVQ